MNGKIHHLHYSFLWAVRRGRGVISGEVSRRFEELVRQVGEGELGCEVIEVSPSPGGEYVSLTLLAPPSLSPDQIVFRLRRATAHTLKEEFPELRKMPSLWTRGYLAESEDGIAPQAIKEYLDEQKENRS